METRSIWTKEAAVLLRAALKRKYPRVKFSVRFESYSMGSHINVSWTDGPTQRAVEAFAAPYSGSRFESMDDSTYSVYSWLLPDGTATHAERGARGSAMPPGPTGAELVSFHGSLPSCNRELSPQYVARCSVAWDGLSAAERCALLNADRFPRWEGQSAGYKLAWFFDADQIMAPMRKAA
jgi:hypothetical protein